MRNVLILTTLLFVGVLGSTPMDVRADEPECDPYPIGRCGEYNRETVTFCYVLVDGQYVDATDHDAIGVPGASDLGVDTGVPQLDESLAYVRTGPTTDLLAEPFTAPFPFGSVYQETNNVPGLQTESFRCGKWVWFPECVPQQWMGPTGVVTKRPDQLVS